VHGTVKRSKRECRTIAWNEVMNKAALQDNIARELREERPRCQRSSRIIQPQQSKVLNYVGACFVHLAARKAPANAASNLTNIDTASPTETIPTKPTVALSIIA
jgi:hypothetical protein